MQEIEENEFTTGDYVALITLGIIGAVSLLCTAGMVWISLIEPQETYYELTPMLFGPAAAGAAGGAMIWFRQRHQPEGGWLVAAVTLTISGILLSCLGISVAFSYDEPNNFLSTAIGSAVICIAPGIVALIIGVVLYFSKAVGRLPKDNDDFFADAM